MEFQPPVSRWSVAPETDDTARRLGVSMEKAWLRQMDGGKNYGIIRVWPEVGRAFQLMAGMGPLLILHSKGLYSHV